MADITPDLTDTNQGVLVFWETLSAANDALPIALTGNHMCVQIVGTWDGATVAIQGSNDGTNYVTLENENGDAGTLTANGLLTVQARPRYVKPVITVAGGGSVDVDVYLFIAE